MKYKVVFPITRLNGPFSVTVKEGLMESKEDAALWHYNSALAHDGNGPVSELPSGTKFVPADAESAPLPRGDALKPRGA